MIIITIIFLLFYIVAPLKTKIVLAIINVFLPDPIPYVDELIMWGNALINLVRMRKILEFIEEHKCLSIFSGIISAILIFIFIF